MVKKKMEIPLEVRKSFVKEIGEHLVKGDDCFINILIVKGDKTNKFKILSDLELEEIIGYIERLKHDLINNKNVESSMENDFPSQKFVR